MAKTAAYIEASKSTYSLGEAGAWLYKYDLLMANKGTGDDELHAFERTLVQAASKMEELDNVEYADASLLTFKDGTALHWWNPIEFEVSVG